MLFSNALDTDKAIEIQRYAENRVKPSFGIGTHFTNDFPHVKPMNIVIKLVAVKITESWPFYNETVKSLKIKVSIRVSQRLSSDSWRQLIIKSRFLSNFYLEYYRGDTSKGDNKLMN